MYNLTEKNRGDAIKAIQEVQDIWTAVFNATGKRLHVAQVISIDCFTHEVHSEYALFNDFVSADKWVSERYEVRGKYSPFGQTYLNGEMKDQWCGEDY